MHWCTPLWRSQPSVLWSVKETDPYKMPVIIICVYMYHVLPLTSVLWLISPFSIEKLSVSYYPDDTEKADMRIVQAAAQGLMISLYSLEYTLSLSLSNDMCVKCYTEGLSCAPAIQLEYGQVLHYQYCHNACYVMSRCVLCYVPFVREEVSSCPL